MCVGGMCEGMNMSECVCERQRVSVCVSMSVTQCVSVRECVCESVTVSVRECECYVCVWVGCFPLEDVEGADIKYKSLRHDKKTLGLTFHETNVLLNFEGSWGNIHSSEAVIF